MSQKNSQASSPRPSLKRSLSGHLWDIYNLHYPVKHRLRRSSLPTCTIKTDPYNCHERENYDKKITVELLNARSSYLRWVNSARWDTADPLGPPPEPARVKHHTWTEFSWPAESTQSSLSSRSSSEHLSPCSTLERKTSDPPPSESSRSQKSLQLRNTMRKRLSGISHWLHDHR